MRLEFAASIGALGIAAVSYVGGCPPAGLFALGRRWEVEVSRYEESAPPVQRTPPQQKKVAHSGRTEASALPSTAEVMREAEKLKQEPAGERAELINSIREKLRRLEEMEHRE